MILDCFLYSLYLWPLDRISLVSRIRPNNCSGAGTSRQDLDEGILSRLLLLLVVVVVSLLATAAGRPRSGRRTLRWHLHVPSASVAVRVPLQRLPGRQSLCAFGIAVVDCRYWPASWWRRHGWAFFVSSSRPLSVSTLLLASSAWSETYYRRC